MHIVSEKNNSPKPVYVVLKLCCWLLMLTCFIHFWTWFFCFNFWSYKEAFRYFVIIKRPTVMIHWIVQVYVFIITISMSVYIACVFLQLCLIPMYKCFLVFILLIKRKLIFFSQIIYVFSFPVIQVRDLSIVRFERQNILMWNISL